MIIGGLIILDKGMIILGASIEEEEMPVHVITRIMKR